MKIGAAQFASESGDVDANIEIHRDWVARGRSEKLDILVMPEMSLTGYYGTDMLLHAAMTCSDRRLMRLAEEAGDMIVVVGFIEEGLAAQFYNTAAMLKDGKVVHLHRKVNLANYGKLDEGKHLIVNQAWSVLTLLFSGIALKDYFLVVVPDVVWIVVMSDALTIETVEDVEMMHGIPLRTRKAEPPFTKRSSGVACVTK